MKQYNIDVSLRSFKLTINFYSLKIQKFILFLLIITTTNFSTAQINIKNADSLIIGHINKNILFSYTNQVVYNYKGFLIFNGVSNYKNDIVYTVDILRNKTVINNNVETQPEWIIKNNTIFWFYKREKLDLISIKKENGFISFYNNYNDSLIGFLDTEKISKIELVLAFVYLWNDLKWEKICVNTSNVYESETGDLPKNILASMKPVFGDETNTWLWDGKYFFPAYNNDQRYIWEYDGNTIKPTWNSKIENEWSWDGEELKPFWGGHPRNNWRWENGILRQVFENNYKNEYEIVDNIVRKRFGSYGENEWEVTGNMPLPVLTIILLGIVARQN